MTLALLIGTQVSVIVLLVAIGMGSTFSDVRYLWQRPRLLGRSLLAMYVVVPLAAFGIVSLIQLTPAVKAALLVLAVSAGAPLLPRKLGSIAGSPYAFSLVVTSSLLAIVLVPTWLAVMSRHFGVQAEITLERVAWVLAKAFLLPLAAGMLFRAFWPKVADWLAGRAIRLGWLALLGCGLLLLASQWEVFQKVGTLGFAALMLTLVVGLAIGHAMGGPEPDDRTALALACCTRHVGIAVLVASAFTTSGTLALVAIYVIATALVSIPYLAWRRRTAAPSRYHPSP